MAILINILIGVIGAFVGVLPPGLINVYALKVSLTEGRQKALIFSAGVCITVIIQTIIALVFARYLEQHPEVVDLLQKVALGIFIALTIYFFFIAKDTRREIETENEKSKTRRFFSGMLVAALNLLPLPYWVYIGITFSAFGWFSFGMPDLYFAALGSGIGTFLALAVYVYFLKNKETPKSFKINMNYVIGVITAVISIITFLKILKEM